MIKEVYYNFSEEKNALLKENRKISFDDIISAIKEGYMLDIIPHPNQERYSGQEIYIIEINEYVYAVPFIQESENSIFLKTIFPSRKAKKQYLGGSPDVR